MMRTVSVTTLALSGAASAAVLIAPVEPALQGLALVHAPIDDTTNALLLGDASSALMDTAYLEGSQLYFNLEGDYPYTGWIPPEYRNWTQVYTRPVLEGQDNGPGLSVNEDNILNYNGTEDGFYACLLDGVFTLYFGEEPDTNKPGQQCLNITLNATDV